MSSYRIEHGYQRLFVVEMSYHNLIASIKARIIKYIQCIRVSIGCENIPYKYLDAWHTAQREYLKNMTANDKTIRRNELALEKAGVYFEFVNPLKVSLGQMKAREAELTAKGLSTNSIADYTAMLRAFLMYVGNEEAKNWKPMAKKHPKVDGVFLNEAQIADIRAYIDSRCSPMESLLFSLMVDNGLRIGDCKRITMENARELLTSMSSNTVGKGRNGGKVALLELAPITLPYLQRYMAYRARLVQECGSDHPMLIVRKGGCTTKKRNQLVVPASSQITKEWIAVAEGVGIDFRFHDLRRTYGNRLHRRNVPIEEIARMLRHESINTSLKCYIGINKGEMRKVANLFS